MRKQDFPERQFIFVCLRRSAAGVFAGLSITTLALALLLLSGLGAPTGAQDVISQEEPTPSSVDEIITPIERSFIERIPRPGFFPWLKEQLRDTPPFFRDTEIDLNLRSFYFRCDKFDDSVSSAWAMGGALAYTSGWLLDRVMVGTTFYWSERLYGPKDKDGTLLLKPGQHGYTVLGQLWLILNPILLASFALAGH